MVIGVSARTVSARRQPLLSVVIPFHNSVGKCESLLTTLACCEHEDLELILVDDGSTDDTVDVLEHLSGEIKKQVQLQLILQENRGPGGARNAGLRAAAGEYVWFVDSDDDIMLSAVDIVREMRGERYDFIDFNVLHEGAVVNTMGLPRGEYASLPRSPKNPFLGNGYGLAFGRLWTKIFRRQFLCLVECDDVGLYPEYCFYEDNPLAMIFALTPCRFYKSDVVAYHHIVESPVSITRGTVASPRSFDRVLTAAYGFQRARGLVQRSDEVAALLSSYVRLGWHNTLGTFGVKMGRPSSWMMALKLTRRFRDDARTLGLSAAQCLAVRQSHRRKLFHALLWVFSHLLTRQGEFDERRQRAWGRAIRFPCWEREPPGIG